MRDGLESGGPRSPIRPAGRAPRAAATPPPLLPGARPAALGGLSPRMRPIYYVWAAPTDHAADRKNKTAGRRPAVFAKYGVWSRGRG